MTEIKITSDDAELIIAFVKNFEREEISDELWDVIMRLCDEMED